MWPGGELPVCRSGQQETRVWGGGAGNGIQGMQEGRPLWKSVPTGHWGWGAGGRSWRRVQGGTQQGWGEMGVNWERRIWGDSLEEASPQKMEGDLRVWEGVGL